MRRKISSAEPGRFGRPTCDHRGRRIIYIEPAQLVTTLPSLQIIKKHVRAQNHQSNGQCSSDGKLYAKQRVRKKHKAQDQKRYSPGDRITVKLTRDRIFLGVRRQAGAHELRRST